MKGFKKNHWNKWSAHTHTHTKHVSVNAFKKDFSYIYTPNQQIVSRRGSGKLGLGWGPGWTFFFSP